jgi:hypothetical protein
MGTNSSKSNLILIVILAILLGITFGVKKKSTSPIPPEVVMTTATQAVLTYSPTASSMWKDISALQRENKLELTIKDGDLHGNILGQTSISLATDKIICNIIIDTNKARFSGDRVEPLLGHELKHVWDALFLYDKKNPITSTELFLAIVDRDKQIIHNNREVELSAITTEDKIRTELLKSGADFNGMPPSRAEADIKFTTRSHSDNPILRKALLE